MANSQNNKAPRDGTSGEQGWFKKKRIQTQRRNKLQKQSRKKNRK